MSDDSTRDDRGRFRKGNPGGPGNPNARSVRELQAALHEVVTPQRLKALLAMLFKAAVERQDVGAARLLLERVLGKPRSEPVADAMPGLPNGLESTQDVTRAANALLQGVASGTLAPEDAQRMAVLIEMARRALETQDLDHRLRELEQRAQREPR